MTPHPHRHHPAVARSGAVLVTVVLILVAGTFLTHALLLLAQQERLASAASRDLLGARTASETALWETIDGAVPVEGRAAALWDSVVVGDQVVGGVDVAAGWLRLDAEVWYVWTRAAVGVAQFAAARAVWALDPTVRLLGLDAVVTVGPGAPIAVAGRVSADRVFNFRTLGPTVDCSALDEIAPGLAVAPIAIRDALPIDVFGSLDDSIIAGRLPITLGARGSPQPNGSFGTCDREDPWNWGDPLRSGRPCSAYLTARRAPSSVVVEGGVGQGLLVLEAGGELRDLSFFGLVVSRGPVTLSGTTTIVGYLVAEGGVTIESTAAVEGSACWARAALSIPQLLAPVHLPESGGLGPIR